MPRLSETALLAQRIHVTEMLAPRPLHTHDSIAQQTAEFLARGGAVQEFAPGATGVDPRNAARVMSAYPSGTKPRARA